MMSIFFVVMLGAGIGLLMGLTGAGGGILAVPLLVFALHLDVATAGPVALAAVASAAALGAVLGLRQGLVRYRAAMLMAATGLVLVPAGLWLATRIPAAPLAAIFGLVLMFVAGRTFWLARRELQGDPVDSMSGVLCHTDPDHGRFVWTAPCARALAISGAAAGLLSGLLGVGGGFVIVPALRRFAALSMQSVTATSLAVLALVTGGAAAIAAISGRLPLVPALPFVGGAMIGLLAGRRWASRVAGPRLAQVFATVTLVVAFGMLFRGLAA